MASGRRPPAGCPDGSWTRPPESPLHLSRSVEESPAFRPATAAARRHGAVCPGASASRFSPWGSGLPCTSTGRLPSLGLECRPGGSSTRARRAPTDHHSALRSPLTAAGPHLQRPQLDEGHGFRFSRHQDDGTPVTWSPCRPIHYVIRPDNGPPVGEQMIHQAFANLGSATGLEFVHDGVTAEGPVEDRRIYQPEVYGDRWAPVLVAWATRNEVPDFGVDIIGEAAAFGVATPSGDRTYVSGVVYLDAGKMAEVSSTRGVAPARAVIQHELGHLVGLAHVDDDAQLMTPRAGVTTDFQHGDRAGLAALGSGPCQPDA
jgi:hypothetical protein